MDMNNQFNVVQDKSTALPVARTFMSAIFGWMFLALSITALTAWIFASSPSFIGAMFNPETGGMTLLGWVITLAPLGFVIWMSAGFYRYAASTLALLYVIFSVLMGMSLSFIFLAFTGASIAKTFLITAGMFGTMALVGYTTKTDLTKFGSIMFMGLIGIVIASLVNMFMHSSTFDYIISFLGVLIFTGLTAWDVQKLKRIGAGAVEGADNTRKMVIMGALTLYLDFINLFLFLLRFFGNRK